MVDVYLYLCAETGEVRETSVIDFCSVYYMCDDIEGREKVKSGADTYPTPVELHQRDQALRPHPTDESLSTVQYTF